MKTMMRSSEPLVFWLLASALLHAGCSVTHEVGYGPSETPPVAIAPYLEDREAAITRREGGHTWGTVTGVTAESLYLARKGSRAREALPLGDILTIETKSGTSYGPVIGGIAGALAGGIAGYLIADKAWGGNPEPGSLGTGYYSGSTTLGILIGAIVGTSAGVAIGSNTPPARTFVFPADSLRRTPAR